MLFGDIVLMKQVFILVSTGIPALFFDFEPRM